MATRTETERLAEEIAGRRNEIPVLRGALRSLVDVVNVREPDPLLVFAAIERARAVLERTERPAGAGARA